MVGNQESGQPTDQLECKICRTIFTSSEHKKRHTGTKKHRRNLREARREAIYGNDVKKQQFQWDPQMNIFERSDYSSTRERYSQKPNKDASVDSATAYASSVAAYWSVELLQNPSIENFQIAFNDIRWGCFGNVVLEIEFKPLPEKAPVQVRYAVNFRNVRSSNTKPVDSFQEGPFNFQDISDQISEIQNNCQESEKDTRFLIFSTATSCLDKAVKFTYRHKEEEIYVIARSYSNATRLLLNSAEDNESVYRFFPQESNGALSNMYVYMGQRSVQTFPQVIMKVIASSFGEKPLEIAQDFIKYISKWAKSKKPRPFKLNKENVMVKLGELLLSPFQISPRLQTLQGPIERFRRWVEVIRNVDVTILKLSDDLNKLFEPFHLQIESAFKSKIDIEQNIIRMNILSDIPKMNNTILLIELELKKHQNNNISIPLNDCYVLMWMAGLMPLILQVKNEAHQEHVLNTLDQLKQFGLNRQYILIANNSVSQFHNLAIAANLDDMITNIDLGILSGISLHVAENFSIPLSDVIQSDKLFAKSVSVKEFFYMSLGECFLKPGWSTEEKTEVVLKQDLMDEIERSLESRRTIHSIRKFANAFEGNWLREVNPRVFQ